MPANVAEENLKNVAADANAVADAPADEKKAEEAKVEVAAEA